MDPQRTDPMINTRLGPPCHRTLHVAVLKKAAEFWSSKVSTRFAGLSDENPVGGLVADVAEIEPACAAPSLQGKTHPKLQLSGCGQTRHEKLDLTSAGSLSKGNL